MPLARNLTTILVTPLLGLCVADGGAAGPAPDPAPGWRAQAARMVRTQLEARGIADARVLEAMARVPRHRFVPEALEDRAWYDGALPIGHRQTISQPYVVARMTELLEVGSGDVVLEIGTGSGYQAAVLARLAKHVHTIEIIPAKSSIVQSAGLVPQASSPMRPIRNQPGGSRTIGWCDGDTWVVFRRRNHSLS